MAPIQLHVLGPAFGVPSIDPECNAAIALCQAVLTPPDEPWEIIPSHAPTNLPYLLFPDSRTLRGYAAIAQHLSPETAKLTQTQLANSTALTHFLHSTAQPLLDTSLYLPSENYTRTRAAFTPFLPWHANYTLPPRLRAAAKTRTRHLGLTALDLDAEEAAEHDDTSNRPSNLDPASVGREPQQGFEAEAHKRASLLLPRKETLRSLLMRPENKGVFKLKALADQCLGPLGDVLGEEGEWLLGTREPMGVDFLAYGYLALMVFPVLPQEWLREMVGRRYERVQRFVERMHERLGLGTEVGGVVELGKCSTRQDVEGRRKALGMKLPWSPPESSSLVDVVGTLAEGLLSHVPLFAPGTTITTIEPRKPNAIERYFPTLLGLTSATVAASLYYAFSTGKLIWPHGEQVQLFGWRRFADYGHLGAALAGLGVAGQQTGSRQGAHDETEMGMGSPLNLEVVVNEKGDA